VRDLDEINLTGTESRATLSVQKTSTEEAAMMDPLQMTALVQDAKGRLPHSALPDAPVVADTATVWSRGRASIAVVLRRMADAVAPSDFVPAARPTLSTGGRAC
jgi:hypothetical protein